MGAELKVPRVYGLVAVFDNPAALVAAASDAHAQGYRKMDAYTPIPIEGLSEAIGFHHTKLPWLVLGGGLLGATFGFMLQYYLTVHAYPINIGGKPLLSWPAFIPIIFECTILFAVLTAVFGMLGLNGLPQPYHPIFNTPHFELASRSSFFLCIEADDPKFQLQDTAAYLRGLKPTDVAEVEQ